MMNYPNGLPRRSPSFGETSSSKKITKRSQKTNFGKRGMNFEDEINQSNEYYRNHELAVIYKKPTPIQIVHVDYPRRSAAKITEAYFRQASTTDYNGVYKGYYLDFEAKETKNKTSFPLNNFHDHQIQHMDSCQKQKGIAFVLLWFSSLNRCFLLPFPALKTCWSGEGQSMSLSYIEEHGFEIQLGIAPRIPYLTVIDKLINNRESCR